MARIGSYPIDAVIQDKDAWIGTQNTNRVTRQFTALGVAEYIDTKNVGLAFVGATNALDGKKGLVPAPLAGQQGMFLKGDLNGGWTTVPIGDFLCVGQSPSYNSLVGGTNYVAGDGINTTGGSGTGMTVDTTVIAEIITDVVINNPGQGYVNGDIITINGGNANATITLTSGSNNINPSLRLTDPESNNDDVVLTGGTNITITRTSATEITFTSPDLQGVTAVTGTLPIVSSGGFTPDISINTFTGSDGTVAGTKGAVPQPAIADNGKYLKGDGSWASIDVGVETITPANSTFVNLTETGTASAPVLTPSLSATGTASGTTFLRGDDKWEVPIDTQYLAMTSTVLGLGKLFSDTEQAIAATSESAVAARTYGVQFNSSEQLVVNVPWTDTQNPHQTLLGTGSDNTDSGIILNESGGTVLVLGAGSVTAAQNNNIITLTGVNTVYDYWTLSDGTNTTNISSQATASFVAGTYITTTESSGELTISHNATSRTDTTPNPTSSPSPGDTVGLVTAVASNTEGHVTGTTVTDVTWPSDTDTNYVLNKAANSTDLILSADGTTQNTIQFAGTTNEVTVTGVTENAYQIGLPDDVTIGGELTVSGTNQSSFSGQVTIPSTPVANTDAASKAYVDGLVEGGLTFKGSFNAATGAIVGTSNFLYQVTAGGAFDPTAARVLIEVGDYYVVATAGDFYGSSGTGTCATTQSLGVGSSVIGLTAALVNASVCSDWSIVQSTVGVTDFSNTFGTFITGTNNSSTAGSVSLGAIDLVNNTVGVLPSATNFYRGDGNWITPTDTTYDLEGIGTTNADIGFRLNPIAGANDDILLTGDGTVVTTSRSGNTITITGTNTEYGIFTAAPDSTTNGAPGLVPGPLAATSGAPTTYFLNADAAFSIPTGTYTLPAATSAALGGIKIGYTDNAKNYAVELDADSEAYVNVPWADTVYTAGNGITFTGTPATVINADINYISYSGNNNFIVNGTQNSEGSVIPTGSQIIYADPSGTKIVNRGLVSDLPFTNNTGGPFLPLAGGTLTGALTGTTATFSGNVTAPTFIGALTGNATTSTTFSTGRTNYKGVTDGAVAGQMMWKHYGDNHTIFDASNSTSPTGTAVNATNSATAWTATYPTLMGWNGTGTFGVRVDSARIADTSADIGNYLPLAGGALTGATSITVGTNTTTFSTTNEKLKITNSSNASASGLSLLSSNGTWQMELHGSGSNYGFLGSDWGAWNLRKALSGGLYLNNNTTYFVQPEGTSNMNAATFAGNVQVDGTRIAVINASDPIVRVGDTDTNYSGAMRWLSSSNVLEFFTRYAGTYYTNNLVLDRGNVGIGTSTPTAKLDIQGSLGQLFSVTDNLTGSIFAVSDISGVPIFDVNSSGAISFNGTTNYGASGEVLTSNGNAAPTWQAAGGSSPWTTSGNDIYYSSSSNGASVGIVNTGGTGNLYFNDTNSSFIGNLIKFQYDDNGYSDWNNEQILTLIHGNNQFWKFGVSTNSNAPKFQIKHGNGNTMPSSNSMNYSMVQICGENSGNNNPPLMISAGTSGNSSTYMAGFLERSSSSGGYIMKFFNQNYSDVGSIRYTSGQNGVQFNTSSDYRLKEDLQDFKGLDMVLKIPVYDFKWKRGENRSYGVMAHELQEVLPQAVSEKKDSKHMQGVDYSKVVPLLIKSIQELKAEIEILKNK